jgi:hypothetical protein
MALTDYTDPDQPKRKGVNPLRFIPGINLIPAGDETVSGPRPASQDPFANPAALKAAASQQAIAAPAPPTAPKAVTADAYGQTPPVLGSGLSQMSRVPMDIGAPSPKPAPVGPALTDTLTTGKTGGGQAIASDPGRSVMDIYRNELAITAEDRANAGPKAGFIANSDAARTISPSMPAGLSARQQAQFLNQQQQTQAQLRGQDLNYDAALGSQGVNTRGQDLTHQATMAQQGLTARGQDLTAQEAGQRIGLLQSGDQRLSERWNLERPTLEDQAKDARAIREARINIANAITSGDPQAVATERAKAEALGIKFGSDNIHIAPTATTDAQGNVIKGYDVLDASGRKIGGSGGQQAQQQLPPGMTRQVGTSNGKPVYEDQNGKRFIGN